jgi:hypothetical protein
VVAALRALAPCPDAPTLTEEARARLQGDVLARIDHAEHGPAAWLRGRAVSLAPLVLVGACFAAVAGLVLVSIFPSGSVEESTALPVVAEPAAVQALGVLAVVASDTASPVVGEDQYVYVRSTVITNEGELGGPVGLGAPHEREIWLSQATSTPDRGLIREFGQDWPLGGGGATPVGPDRPTVQWMSTLPTDPDRIITELSSHQEPGSPLSSDEYTFERIGDLISEGLVPPDLASGLFRAVTKIPGVTYVPDAIDAVGRRGFGIARTDEFSHITTMWIFRSGSPDPLGTRWYFSGPATDPATNPAQVLFGATAILERGVSDHLGIAPASASST